MAQTYYERMTSATISDETKELLGILGTLHDLVDQCTGMYERTSSEKIAEAKQTEICDAFAPALTLIEHCITERLQDFFIFSDATTI